MKLFFIIISFFLLQLFFAENINAQWATNDTYWIQTNQVLNHNGILFSSCSSGIYKSTNNGVTWIKLLNNSVNKGNLVSNGTSLYFLKTDTQTDTLYNSTDNGNTWGRKPMPPSLSTHKLFVVSSILFVTSDIYLHLSTDNGASWSNVFTWQTGLSVQCMTALNSVIYAGTSGSGVYKSTNNGLNWSFVGLTNKKIYKLVTSLQNIVGVIDSSTGVRKFCVSSNGGLNWSLVPTPINGDFSLEDMSSSGSTVYASGYISIYKSTNSGYNWTVIDPEIVPNVYSICLIGNRVFAGGNVENIYYSDNDFLSYEQSYLYMKKANSIILADNIMLAATSNGVFTSPSLSQNWIQTSLNNFEVFDLITYNGKILAGTKNNGIYYSTNNGASWSQTSLINKSVQTFFVYNNKIYAGTVTNGIYVSNDGLSWSQTNLINQTVNCITNFNSNLYCGTESNGIFVSSDAGSSWSPTSYNSSTVYCMLQYGTYLLAGTLSNGIKKSTDGGQSWTQFFFENKTVNTFFRWNNFVLAGVVENGFSYSPDGGFTWGSNNQGMIGFQISKIMTTENKIYVSTYGAAIWQRNISGFLVVAQTVGLTPDKFQLLQNFPNPFNPNTKIKFNIPNSSFVELRIYNSSGQEVKTLANEKLSSGSYEVTWNAANLPSGIYFYKLTSENFSETKKMILLK